MGSGLRRFARDTGGFSTPLGLIWAVLLLVIGGLAVDTTNAWRNRAMLQAVADAAAHAAALKLPPPARPLTTERRAEMVAEAVRIAELHLDPAVYGDVVTAENVDIGTWDHASRSFTPDTEFPDAVRVRALRTGAGSNAVPTLLLKLGVLDQWDVGASAISQKFLPRCTRDGIISAETAEITSNNLLRPPFCLHGEMGVAMSSGNTFEEGVSVSMPDFSMLSLPMGGWTSNVGLSEALSTTTMFPRMVNQVERLFTSLQDIRSPDQPDYIANGFGLVKNVEQRNFDATYLGTNNVHIVACGKIGDSLADSSSNKMIKIESGDVVEYTVIVTNCAVQISSGALIADSIIITSNSGSSSISGNSGATIGRPDGCAPGGGVVLMSMGSVSFPSTAYFHEAQIVARGEVQIAAAPEGITGIAIQALGKAKMTASGGFALCPHPDDPPYMADYFRIVN
ncbi:hypothetical protein HMH01_16730 [Halovulum dunhuangense]|uniref:Flp pilus-assembly TadE/G-like protein n=2 Tax=Halovulum dunhuangense TaxID=1505036 RepID=A0A849L7G8_9RHOB|nr:hypothetical protein [Halovulum dunhuangense]